MPETVTTTVEYAIDWRDGEIEDGFESAEDAHAFIKECTEGYLKQGWSLDPIKDGLVVTREVTVTTVATDWTPALTNTLT